MELWNQAIQRLHRLMDSLTENDETMEAIGQLGQNWEKSGSAYLAEVWNAVRNQDVLLQTLKAINGERDLNKLFNLIIDKAIDLTNAERGFLLVKEIEIARNFTGEDIAGEYKISKSVAERVRERAKPLLTDNALADPELAGAVSIQTFRLVSILCVPIILKDQAIGVIYLDNRLLKRTFRQHHVVLLSMFAEQAAIALENARLNREIMDRSQELHLLNTELHKEVENQSQKLQVAKIKLEQLQRNYNYHNIYGRSSKMQEMFRTMEKIKEFDLPVLIQGESGTGKELVAQAIHFAGCRKDKPFVSENCAAIAESLFESELFGYEKGAFTGAQQTKKGLFEEANGGTLFLDEIGELSLEMQKKLLRVLAEKSIRRVGGHSPIPVDVRIITATNRNLKEMVNANEFREDLFYRLNCVTLAVPSLRERREDIPILVEHFIEEAAKIAKSKPKKVDRAVLTALLGYDWPGNVRQLRNEILRLSALSDDLLTTNHLSPEIKTPNKITGENAKICNLPQLLRDVEKREILKAMEYTGQNKVRASQLLGISRFTLQRKLEKLGLE